MWGYIQGLLRRWLLCEKPFRVEERETLTFLDAMPKWSRELTPLPSTQLPPIPQTSPVEYIRSTGPIRRIRLEKPIDEVDIVG